MRPIDADKLREEWLENGENEYVYDTNAVLESIDRQPTIEAETETAEWIMDEIERDPIIEHGRVYRNYSATFRCSKCYTTFAGSNLYFNYCPYCGKKMKGVKNNG